MKNVYLGPSFLFFIIFFIAIPTNVYAYLDPGVGSVFFQFLAAALVGVGFTIKMFWGGIKSFFSNKNKNKDEKSSDTSHKLNQESSTSYSGEKDE